MAIPAPILLIEDDAGHAELTQRALEDSGIELALVSTLSAARAWLSGHEVALILADLRLPDGSGLELLGEGLPVVVLTSQGDEARAVAAMKGGALDYLVKSPDMYRDLPFTIKKALRAARSEREKLQAEASLKESEARFRQLAENIQEAFWLYDFSSQDIIYANPAWLPLFGSQVGLDQRLNHVIAEDLPGILAVWPPTAPTEVEYRLNQGGRTVWILERIVPIYDGQGRLARVAGLSADITRRRELELSLRQSQKMEAVGQLAGGVAHDFNNMLTAILSAAEELRFAQTSEERESLAELITTAAERVADLTRKLLAFSRKGRVQNQLVPVHRLVEETTAILARSIDPKVRIETHLTAPRSLVRGDAGQLQHALLNLGINARDAMPNGGVLRYETRGVTLGSSEGPYLGFALEPGEYLQLVVQDSGVGIPPHFLGRIFEPFFTLKEVGKGTGLGLAAVYGTVVEHKGAIDVRSTPGQGTTFSLWLPLAPEGLAVEGAPPAVVGQGRGTVLLVDDEPLVLAAGVHMLNSLGYRVVTARDGLEALQKFNEQAEEIGAVVCDVVMPNLSGSIPCARYWLKNPIYRLFCVAVIPEKRSTPRLRPISLSLFTGAS